ncbi:hypothetical protein AAG906_006448 [Vitis piasezkii]
MRKNDNSFHYSTLETCKLVDMIYKMKSTKPLCISVRKNDLKIVMDLLAFTTNEVTHHKMPSIYTNKVTHIYYTSDIIFINTGEVGMHHLNSRSSLLQQPVGGIGNKCLIRAWSMHWNHEAIGQIPEFLSASWA